MTTKRALKTEAKLAPIEFEFDGEEYSVAHPDIWPLEVMEARERGMFATAIESLLGSEQYATFKKKPRTVKDLADLTTTLFEAADSDEGESED